MAFVICPWQGVPHHLYVKRTAASCFWVGLQPSLEAHRTWHAAFKSALHTAVCLAALQQPVAWLQPVHEPWVQELAEPSHLVACLTCSRHHSQHHQSWNQSGEAEEQGLRQSYAVVPYVAMLTSPAYLRLAW